MSRISRKQQIISNLPKQIFYKAALYERLSKEEYAINATEKLKNQHELLLKYISNKPELKLVQVYQDNGRTGRNFEREAWKQLIEDIQNEKINCIIVKDLSRLGRNYIELGTYLETIFPFFKVRVIAINDSYDSNLNSNNNNFKSNNFKSNNNFNSNYSNLNSNETEKNIYQLKNVINDFYSKDLSKKLQTARKIQREKGEFTGNCPPYGYKRDTNKKGHFLIDNNTVDIVKRIFLEAEQGKSYLQIAKQLNIEGVDSPRKYFKTGGAISPDKNYIWTYQTIRNIVKNPVYLGHMIQNNTLKKEKVCVYHTHEAIISQEKFDKIQKIILDKKKEKQKEKDKKEDKNTKEHKNKKISAADMEYLFCNRIYDGVTQKKMVKTRYDTKNKAVKAYKSAKVFNQQGVSYPLIQIKEDTLIYLVSSILNHYCIEFAEIEKILYSRIQKLEKQIKQCNIERETIKRKIFFLYEDMIKGIITEKDFLKYKDKYSHDIEIIEQNLTEIIKKKDGIQKNIYFSNSLGQWNNILTKEKVEYFIQRIYVFGSRKVEIIFSFQDVYENMICEMR